LLDNTRDSNDAIWTSQYQSLAVANMTPDDYHTYEVVNMIWDYEDVTKLQLLGLAILNFKESAGYRRTLRIILSPSESGGAAGGPANTDNPQELSVEDMKELILKSKCPGYLKLRLIPAIGFASELHRSLYSLIRALECLPDGMPSPPTEAQVAELVQVAVEHHGFEVDCYGMCCGNSSSFWGGFCLCCGIVCLRFYADESTEFSAGEFSVGPDGKNTVGGMNSCDKSEADNAKKAGNEEDDTRVSEESVDMAGDTTGELKFNEA